VPQLSVYIASACKLQTSRVMTAGKALCMRASPWRHTGASTFKRAAWMVMMLLRYKQKYTCLHALCHVTFPWASCLCNISTSLAVACLVKLASLSLNAGSALTWVNQPCISASIHLSTERQIVHVSHVSSQACALPCMTFALSMLSWAVRVEP